MLAISRRGGVAELTLDRPPVNAIDDAMIVALHGALDELSADPDFQVLHIRSNAKVFAAGADLALIRSWKDAPSPGGAPARPGALPAALAGFGLLVTPEGLTYGIQASLREEAQVREQAARVARVAERVVG